MDPKEKNFQGNVASETSNASGYSLLDFSDLKTVSFQEVSGQVAQSVAPNRLNMKTKQDLVLPGIKPNREVGVELINDIGANLKVIAGVRIEENGTAFLPLRLVGDGNIGGLATSATLSLVTVVPAENPGKAEFARSIVPEFAVRTPGGVEGKGEIRVPTSTDSFDGLVEVKSPFGDYVGNPMFVEAKGALHLGREDSWSVQVQGALGINIKVFADKAEWYQLAIKLEGGSNFDHLGRQSSSLGFRVDMKGFLNFIDDGQRKFAGEIVKRYNLF